jgi:tetratricopeptide (TPR) repeat protein
MRPRVLAMAISLFAIAGVGGFLAIERIRGSASSREGLDSLLAQKKFDEVERRLGEYLRSHPASVPANMLMAQVALARDSQKPSVALRHLSRINVADRSTRAIVLLNEGKAYSALRRYKLAETAWKTALRLEPQVPEAGWALLGLYYVQGRRRDAHDLGISLGATEPDPRDRAQLLLELLRQDVIELVPETVVSTLDPVVRDNPDDVHSAIALGLVLVRNSQIERGLSILEGVVDRGDSSIVAWEGLLRGFSDANRFDELAQRIARLPASIAADRRFSRFRATVAQYRRDWPAAVSSYLEAWRDDPSDPEILERIGPALRAANQIELAKSFGQRNQAMRKAHSEMRAIYDEANAVKDLGAVPHPELYRRLAELREQMGRDDEALAWHRLVLRDNPGDATSREAAERLEKSIRQRQSQLSRAPDDFESSPKTSGGPAS